MRSRRWIVKPKAELEKMFELYLVEYEKRFRRPLSRPLRRGARENITLLVRREGAEVARKAIIAVLTHPKLRWVVRGVDSFIADRMNFARFVEPYLYEDLPSHGEQAEWTGDRSDEPGSEVIW